MLTPDTAANRTSQPNPYTGRATLSGQPRKRSRVRWPSLTASAVIIALLFSVPLLVVLSFNFSGESATWSHVVEFLLLDYVKNSLIIMLGVTIGVLLLGVPAAWLTSVCEFRGRRWMTWALLLPLAIPAYIIAYTYTGLLDFAGPVQTFIRDVTGLGYREYWFPQVRSLNGAIVMFSLVLYPYVYLLARAAFIEQSVCVLEASRSLGCNANSAFSRVALPLARPAIITGLTLALMETLADYGTVAFFGISTFTTGIFRSWRTLNDNIATAQLASVLLGFVIFLVIIERLSRQKARYHHTSNRYSQIKRYQLKGRQEVIAWLACGLPIFFGFVLPIAVLFNWTISHAEPLNADFIRLIWHSLLLAGITAFLAVFLALIAAYALRSTRNRWAKSAVWFVSMGYAIPGLVIAIGVLIPLAWLDHRMIDFMQAQFGVEMGLILSGSLVAVIYAYLVRFLSISINTISSGLTKIKPSMDDAARSMGNSLWGVLRNVHFPLMRSTVLTAFLLVFVDVLKELPATLMLRPLNFNTLAVRSHEMAADERLIDAGPPAITIVLVGLLPVILLSRAISRGRAGQSDE